MIDAVLAVLAADPARYVQSALFVPHVYRYYIGLTDRIADRLLGLHG